MSREGEDPQRGGAAVIGLGLIGGSLARDLAALGVAVAGYDRERSSVDAAIAAGAVHARLDDTLGGVRDCDVVIIATPVDEAVDTLARLAPHVRPSAFVTDVGSTKRRIVAAAAMHGLQARFVGSHPLTGDHRSGWEASRGGLFRDARVYICPPEGATDAQIERANALWKLVGARPEVISAAEHDRTVAWTSHLPHALSVALATALIERGVQRPDLGPGGRDMTRLAGGSPALWAAILEENGDEVDAALDALGRAITDLRGVMSRDRRGVADVLARARRWFEDGANAPG